MNTEVPTTVGATTDDTATSAPAPKIGILVVAYNAATTLAQVLDRVPKDFRSRISQVFICDDASQDSTYLVGLGYQQINEDLPITVIRHPDNLGYGGNQKAGYKLAIEHGLDIIVLLHGDGQYAPECLPEIVAPLERGECEAVFGSRMMVEGAARRGGMPLYKYVGNRILTGVENRMLGSDLSEFHSGYRAYSVKALSTVPFDQNSDGFNFDTQIIIQFFDAGHRIVEVPIPTYYGDEICYVNGLAYAKDVVSDVMRYRMSKLGFTTGEYGDVGDEYSVKHADDSSHSQILTWLSQLPPSRVLDLGCSSGLLSERVTALGHTVTGVDVLEHPGIRSRVEHFVRADLDQALPSEVREHAPYDVVLAADILEHVRQPEHLLADVRTLLAPHGVLIASVPNFGHWYARTRVTLGIFEYDQRGILDQGHVRFFNRRGFVRRIRNAGFEVVRLTATGLPLEVLTHHDGALERGILALNRLLVMVRPTLFGYQFVAQCRATAAPEAEPTATTIAAPHSS